MSDPEAAAHRTARMTGCVRLGRGLLAVVLLSLLLVIGMRCAGPIWSRFHDGRAGDRIRIVAIMKDLSIALGHFHTEYQRYPVPEGPDRSVRSEGVLIGALLALDQSLNPRAIKFIDLPLAKDGRFGLIGMAKDGAVSPDGMKLVDSWGEPYHLTLDIGRDGTVANPEAGADPAWLAQHPQPAALKTHAAIFSAGPDRDPKTWADNITSWRQ